MNRSFLFTVLAAISLLIPSCADHDDPKLAPIDTTQIKITATVKDTPNSTWSNTSEEMTITVSDIEMKAPKGIVLRSISLVANNGNSRGTIDEKPYSGEPLEFKVPLRGLQGRVNFTLLGNLIKKNSRDAEIIISDNIQKIIFSEEPKFECEGWLYVSVKSKSTTGEEYFKTFETRSTEELKIPVPQSELYWTPTTGTASELEISLGSGAAAWSSNTTFECKITKCSIGHSSGDEATMKITIPNTPGSLKALKLQEYIRSTYFGTWENVTIAPYDLTNVFEITETE